MGNGQTDRMKRFILLNLQQFALFTCLINDKYGKRIITL